MPRGKPKPKTIPMPGEEWREAFKGAVCGVRFQLNLSRAMLEFLCAVSDGVQWDRSSFGGCGAPDNWFASERSLERRGLIVRRDKKDADEYFAEHSRKADADKDHWHTWNPCILTPAGEKVVELIKLAGMFVDSDAADLRKFKKA